MALPARGVPKDDGGKRGKEWIESWTTILNMPATGQRASTGYVVYERVGDNNLILTQIKTEHDWSLVNGVVGS